MTAFWLEDPIVLFQQPSVKELWPMPDMCRVRKLNAVSRMVILMTVIGYAISRRTAILVSGVVALAITAIVWLKGKSSNDVDVEGLTSMVGNKKALNDLVGAPVMTAPKDNNPLMNVLIPQINDDPKRPPAEPAYDVDVEKQINEKAQDFVVEQFNNDPKIRELLFSDLPDKMTFDQSMRNFYATPNTTVPNDQGAFAQFCYGEAISCKENNALACERNSFRKYPSV
jgi:hypothetical protein